MPESTTSQMAYKEYDISASKPARLQESQKGRVTPCMTRQYCRQKQVNKLLGTALLMKQRACADNPDQMQSCCGLATAAALIPSFCTGCTVFQTESIDLAHHLEHRAKWRPAVRGQRREAEAAGHPLLTRRLQERVIRGRSTH